MNRMALGICVMASVVLLSACGTAAPATPTSAPTAMDTPAATSAPAQTSAPTVLDACQVITSQDASTLAGATFGPGKEGTTPGGGKTCVYGANTTNVFTVTVGQAADVASAQAMKAQFEADLKAQAAQLAANGLKTTELPNFADGAVIGELNISIGGITISGSGIGFLKGTTFVGFSDVVRGGQAPTTAAMQAEAQSILGKLP